MSNRLVLVYNVIASLKDERSVVFKDNSHFRDYVKLNLWSKRRDNGFGWQCDVFDFIKNTYGEFLGRGLLQSDIRALDQQLYAQFHRSLCQLPDMAKANIIEKLNLPKERSDEALEQTVSDPEWRAAIASHRLIERIRAAAYRARKKAAQNNDLG